jgi:hypothetical protein
MNIASTRIGTGFPSRDIARSARLLKARYERSGAGTREFALTAERRDRTGKSRRGVEGVEWEDLEVGICVTYNPSIDFTAAFSFLFI